MDIDLLYSSSDSVNRHGFRLATTTLELGVKDVFAKGMPMLIGHDFHKPIGWTIPFGVLIEPGLGRMVSRRLLATNFNEQKLINKALRNFLNSRFNERFDEFKEPFFTLLGENLKGDFLRIDCSCIAVLQQGIAPKLFKKLFEGKDYDGLIKLPEILLEFNHIGQGIFKHKSSDLCLFANDFFRRSQSRFNNFHFQFLDELVKLKDENGISIKLRLDEDMIGYFPSAHQSMELEYHWGPKYNDNISNIKTGLTKYASLEGQRNYSGVAAMEFYWKKDKNEITFEAEELMDAPSPQSDNTYRCRYVHSIYDTKKKEFVHFDGAFRSYNFEDMLDRVDKNFVEYGRKAAYQKMFRLDGKIEISTWKSLITHYYQGNELIYEYFGLGTEREAQKLTAPVLSPIERILPYSNLANEGIRVFLSYHALPETIRAGRYVDILDVMMKKDGEKTYSLEHTIYELKAVIHQLGQELEIPDGIDLIKIDDQFWNIPSIMHYGENDLDLFHKTVEALVLLFSGMVKRKLYKIISLTLSFTINKRVVRISAVGAVDELLIWLKDSFPIVFSEDALTQFTEKQRKYVDKYTLDRNKLTADFLLQDDGVLYIKRNAVLFPYQTDFDENDQMRFKIEFPSKEEDPDGLFELMTDKQIGVALAVAIENCYWSDTKENYLTAMRSQWLNKTKAYVMIDKCAALGLYWVDTRTN